MIRHRWLPWVVVFLYAGGGCARGALAQEETGDELIQLVINLLEDKDKDVRALGLEQVRTAAKGQAATRRFAAQLPKLPPDGQVALLRALADRGDPVARTAVLEMLGSEEEAVRVAAIGTVGLLGEAADATALLRLLAKASPAEKKAARLSLVRLRGESVPGAIAAELKRAAPPIQVTLIEILAERRAFDTLPDMLSAAVNADPAVRAAAMQALGKLAGPEQIPGMVKGVLRAQAGREREAAEKCVMFVCQRIPEADKRAEPLLAAMDQLSATDRTAMLSTLGRVGGPPALKVVEAAIADPTLHSTGLRALCNWPDASIAPRLIELVKTDKHASHRITVLRALIRVAPLPDDRTDEQRLALLRKSLTMCTRDEERKLVLQRAQAVRSPQTLRFVLPFLDQPAYAQQACETIVELAHHRGLREPNKAEFDRALDKVIETSRDATVIDRANRYKKGQTWVRPSRS